MTPTARTIAVLTIGVLLLFGVCGAAEGVPQTAYVAPRGPFLPIPVHRAVPFIAATPAPSYTPSPVPSVSLAPQATTRPVVSRVTVRATWFCNHDALRGPLSRCTKGYPGGLYAAVSPDLGISRGQAVTVCYGAACVVVRAVDCLCSRLGGIDLFADAWSRLGVPLSRGVITVTLD